MTNIDNTIEVKSFSGSSEGYGIISVELYFQNCGRILLNIEFEDGLSPRPQIIAINSPHLGNMTAEALKAYVSHAEYIHGLMRAELFGIKDQVYLKHEE